MSATQRGENKSVVQRLLDEPQQFEFAQAVNIMVSWLGEQGVSFEQALTDYVKFDNSLALAFPASQVESLRAIGHGRQSTDAAMLQAMLEEAELSIHITPAFMGFLGVKGALPLHYTEELYEYQHAEKDHGPRAFLDMFSSRVVALFYQAWRHHRVEYSDIGGTDRFLTILSALAGFQRGAGGSNAAGLSDELIARYAGLLHGRARGAIMLERILTIHFGVPFAVEECVGHWSRKAPHEQTCIGEFNTTLGETAMLGAATWRPDLRVRLIIGPLADSAYKQFLPGAPNITVLTKMLTLLADPTLTYEIAPILRALDVRPASLHGITRIGYDSFLMTQPDTSDRAELRYEIQPMAPLPPRRANAQQS